MLVLFHLPCPSRAAPVGQSPEDQGVVSHLASPREFASLPLPTSWRTRIRPGVRVNRPLSGLHPHRPFLPEKPAYRKDRGGCDPLRLRQSASLRTACLHRNGEPRSPAHHTACSVEQTAAVTQGVYGPRGQQGSQKNGSTILAAGILRSLGARREGFARIKSNIEQNPVKAGIVNSAEEYQWSSAWSGPATDREVSGGVLASGTNAASAGQEDT